MCADSRRKVQRRVLFCQAWRAITLPEEHTDPGHSSLGRRAGARIGAAGLLTGLTTLTAGCEPSHHPTGVGHALHEYGVDPGSRASGPDAGQGAATRVRSMSASARRDVSGSYRPPNLLTGTKLSSVMTQFGWALRAAVFPLMVDDVVVEETLSSARRAASAGASVTFLVGVRTRTDGIRLGPNLALDGRPWHLLVGRLQPGRRSIPVDLAVVSSQGGMRTTLLLAMRCRPPRE